jgi:hypothetical protein
VTEAAAVRWRRGRLLERRRRIALRLRLATVRLAVALRVILTRAAPIT